MVDSIEAPAETQTTRPGRLGRLASRRGLIGTAGVFSIVTGGLIGTGWLFLHRANWESRSSCSALSHSLDTFRHSLSFVAFSTAIVATVALARIARSQSVAGRRLLGTFWIASGALWITLAVMLFAAYAGGACERRL